MKLEICAKIFVQFIHFCQLYSNNEQQRIPLKMFATA